MLGMSTMINRYLHMTLPNAAGLPWYFKYRGFQLTVISILPTGWPPAVTSKNTTGLDIWKVGAKSSG